MGAYVFCLEPEKEIFNKILNLKSMVKTLSGNQQYLCDPPHMTLYLGKFRNFFGKRFDSFIQDTLREINSLNLNLEGWEVFGPDIITGKETLVCKVEENKLFKDLQKKLVDSLLRYKKDKVLRRYRNGQTFQSNLQLNITKFGYPFIGEVWKPHLGIASFNEKDFNKVYPHLQNLELIGNYNVQSLVVYKLNDKNDKLKEVKRYKI